MAGRQSQQALPCRGFTGRVAMRCDAMQSCCERNWLSGTRTKLMDPHSTSPTHFNPYLQTVINFNRRGGVTGQATSTSAPGAPT